MYFFFLFFFHYGLVAQVADDMVWSTLEEMPLLGSEDRHCLERRIWQEVSDSAELMEQRQTNKIPEGSFGVMFFLKATVGPTRVLGA